MSANQITKDLLLELPKRFPVSWHWRSNRIEADGVYKGKKRHVSAGIDGMGDITGEVGVNYVGKLFGVRTEIEVKTTDRQSPKQRAFQVALEKVGGIYILTHGVEEALNKLTFLVRGLEAPLIASSDIFYIQDTRQVVGNSALWWREGGHGYTCNLNEAWKVPGTWTGRPTDVLRACAEVDALVERHVDTQKLPRPMAHVEAKECAKESQNVRGQKAGR